MSWGTILFIAFILVCPISMLWMMRHGRRRGDHKAATRETRGTTGDADSQDQPPHRPDPDRNVKIGA